ncbi:MAG: leucine-rich repeat protein [Clostridia bacterium]|nr:leucine-rich repeat protein [Clostridia bacterium]
MNQRGIWQLLLMAREGDRHAIDELFYSSFRPAFLILSSVTGDRKVSLDLLAEGYVQTFQNLDTLETGRDFALALNRFTLGRAASLPPEKDLSLLPDGCESAAEAFREAPPMLHDFDTLPAMNLSSKADGILCALQKLPLAQQICAYLFYYVEADPETIADILKTTPDKVCGALQQTRDAVLPQIEELLGNTAAFRGTDAESAILWALRRTTKFVPAPGEIETFYQMLIEKLVAAEVMEAPISEEEEPKPDDDIPLRDIAPPKEHTVLRTIFSLRTLIIVLALLVVIGLFVGMKQLHTYNARRSRLETHAERTTLSLTATMFPSERYIFSTEYEAPTEAPTETTTEASTTASPTEPVTETAPSTTEKPTPTFTEPTVPVITTTKPNTEFSYTESANLLTITGYSGTKTAITIPDKIDGKTVVAIGENAFFNASITSVKFPTTIRTIGKNAFRSCTSMQSVSLPSGLTTIDSDAFRGCTGLKTVSLPSSLKQIGSQAFSGCSALAGVTLPTSLTTIGDWAFAYCTNLSSIAIPASVTTVGNSVFYECKSLGRCAVENSSRLKALGDAMFFDCTSLKSFTIPSQVKVVPNNCFAGCRSMTSIALSTSITTIGQNAFSDCISLKDFSFSRNLQKIDSGAFSGCSSLKSMTIPSGTTTIGDSAFSDCTGLRSVTIPASVTQIGVKAFSGCDDLVISCPSGSAAEKYAIANHIEIEGRSSSTTYSDDKNNV